jgi:hypothetical protein
MSNYQPKPNTWTLFQNTRKTNETQPDYTGSALLEMPDGTTREYRLSAWKRVSKSDVKFIGGFIKPKEDQAPQLLDENKPAGAGDENPW